MLTRYFLIYLYFINFFSWHNDPFCSGPYPQGFESIERTLRNYRKTKYGKSPNTIEDIEREFSKPDVFEALGLSQFREHGVLYNGIQIEKEFCNCVFSSAKSIAVITDILEPHERFFVMDGTFNITPRGEFKQVLILHAEYGIKVSLIYVSKLYHINERNK